ncbi:hypothetical protein DFP72DRAFT_851851 [Ephemerocybe angulata]|uniref:Uncharacterized protein n=1 Tax=Ephemerocybe angulata TaxID=980116 RepID=A0A8H6HQP8_9AGAR|nr:hypothetical protein DFP72DRAFT_851851 [Tulosesus angulatus]
MDTNALVQDHDEFIARSAVDGLSTRGESLSVPFEHSLREFLEGAADVYQRSLDEYEDGILEARAARQVTVWVKTKGHRRGPFTLQSNFEPLRNLATPISKIHGCAPEEVEFSVPDLSGGWKHVVLEMDRTLDGNGLDPNVNEVTLTARKIGAPGPKTVPLFPAGKGKGRT